MGIRYLTNSEVNTIKWDQCIANSFNAGIFPWSWYLDLACEQWDALVEDDYVSVMPLPWSNILGRAVMRHPDLIYELGIYSRIPIDQKKTNDFLTAIPDHFPHYSIILNKYNPVAPERASRNLLRYEIDLIKAYSKLQDSFTLQLKTDLTKSEQQGLSFIAGLAPNDLLRLVSFNHFRIARSIRKNNYRVLRSLIAALIRFKTGDIFAVYDGHNELVSAAIVAWSNGQIHILLHVVSNEGYRIMAHGYLIDRLIERFAESSSTMVLYNVPGLTGDLSFIEFGFSIASNIEIRSSRFPFPLNIIADHCIFRTWL